MSAPQFGKGLCAYVNVLLMLAQRRLVEERVSKPMHEPTVVDHYRDQYWNDLPEVNAYICRRATGTGELWWMDYFKEKYATPSLKRALVIGCGNGWVERDLYDRGVVESFDAFDAAEHYLKQAREKKGDRPIRYFQADLNTFEPNGKYDCIFNVAALHHVRRLYRLVRKLASALEPHGVFVNWDYVGPSRNQYSDAHLALMQRVNASMPERFRSPHSLRPRLTDMLDGDPTEAVHASDILGAVGQYFEFVENHELGGGVAYQILWNNIAEFQRGDPEAKRVLQGLVEHDDTCTGRGTAPTLFSFFVCKKGTSRPPVRAHYDRLVREPAREAVARLAQGYYPHEILRALRAWWAHGTSG